MDTRMGCFDWSLREPFQHLSFAVLKTTVRVRNKKITTTDPLDGIEERCHGNDSGKGSQIP